MKSITKAQYAMLFFAVDRLKEDSWHTGPYGFDALKERGWSISGSMTGSSPTRALRS